MKFFIFCFGFLVALFGRDFEAKIASSDSVFYLDFKKDINGSLHYGFLDKGGNIRYYKKSAEILDGKSSINLSKLVGKYDFVNWQKNGAAIGYRVVDDSGRMLIESSFGFKIVDKVPVILDGYMTLKPTLIDAQNGEFFGVFETLDNATCIIDGKKESKATKIHKFSVPKRGDIEIECDGVYSLIEPLYKNNNDRFLFAFASDSRGAKGGGDSDLGGTNAGVLKKMFYLALKEKADFFQFTGDMISGYANDEERQLLEYFNFKKASEHYASKKPLYVGMGNHEGFIGKKVAEKLLAEYFVFPKSSLIKEEGDNMPKYENSVYSYKHGNTAMIVLNSNYDYNPKLRKWNDRDESESGGLHGYIMDAQLNWFRGELLKLERDESVKHIFVTVHTPLFPNGGHAEDAMWYGGSNEPRSIVTKGGRLVYANKGVIERRDEIVRAVQKSRKFRAFLCGDEHNYSRLKIDKKSVIYPREYGNKKIKIKKPIIQITNGAAGAPYYGKELLPWSKDVKAFDVRNTLFMIDVNGKKACFRAIDVDSFEVFDNGCF